MMVRRGSGPGMAIPRIWWQVIIVCVSVLCVDNVQSKRRIEERRILGGVEDCGNYPWAAKTISVSEKRGEVGRKRERRVGWGGREWTRDDSRQRQRERERERERETETETEGE